MENDYIIH